jgi:PAS domain S-box-containing protein
MVYFGVSANRFHFLGMFMAVCLCGFLLPVLAQSSTLPTPDPLTPQERAWLVAHPIIRLGIDPAYQPVEFYDEQGQYRGITADYMALLEQRLGLHIQLTNIALSDRPLNDPTAWRVDLRAGSAATPDRLELWAFSKPYLEFPAYLITRNSVSDDMTFKQLDRARIAVVADYAVREDLAKRYPNLILDPVPDTATGLQKTSFGLVDGFVSDLPVATYWMEKEGITNLKITGSPEYVYRLGFGVRKDWPELVNILDKGLALITPDERAAIYRKWVKIPVEPSRFFSRLRLVLLGGFSLAALGLLGALSWNRSLATQVKQRTAELQQELTERKLIEAELRGSEERFATMFRSSPSPLGISRSRDGEILDVNDRWVQLSGYNKAELVGQTAIQTNLWRNSSRRDQLVQLLRTQQRVRDFEATYYTKSGEQRTSLLSVEQITLGAEQCNLWTVHDITERKQAEEAVRQNEILMRSLTETTSAWVFIVQGTQFSYFNAAAKVGLGYTQEELTNKEFWVVIHTDDHQLIRERIQARRQNLPLSPNYEARFLTKTGDMRWLQITTTQIEYQGANALLSTAFDITDRKQTEEQLKISEHQLHKLAGYLQTIREEERTAMAREIHDELGQSLTAMKMDLAWLTKRLPEDQSPLKERVQGMAAVLNDTISTVRRLVTQLRPAILDDLGLEAALEWQAQEFQMRTGITCNFLAEVEVADLEPEHATAIFRICQESLTNVARHAHANNVGIRLWEQQNQLLLEVKDDGQGIITNEISQSRSFGLLGMQERAFLLGGEFQLTSSPNHGTTVMARIPRYQSSAKGGGS